MFEYLIQINQVLSSVPIIGGSLAVALGGGIIAAFWKGPTLLSRIFNSTVVVSFTLNNSGWGNNTKHYIAFIKWFNRSDILKITRSTGYEAVYDSSGKGPSVGSHLFRFKNKWYYLKIKELPSTGSEREKKEICIKTLGCSVSIFDDLFEAFKDKTDDDGELKVKRFRDNYWYDACLLSRRSWDTVILNKEKKVEIVELIEEFYASREWYRERGIPYKLVIVLYGPAGTGKSTVIKALARLFNKNLNLIYLHQMTDNTFPASIETVEQDSFIAIEDFDTVSSIGSRTKPKEEKDPFQIDLSDGGLNLTTVLNTLDGIAELNGQVIFMSTNHLEKIDSALIRTGRVDAKIHIGFLGKEEVEDFIQMMYPGTEADLDFVTEISGSDLQSYALANKRNSEGFLKELKDHFK